MLSCLPPTPDPLVLHPSHHRPTLTTRPDICSTSALLLLSKAHTTSQLKQAHARLLRLGLAHHPTVSATLLRLYSSHRLPQLAFSIFSHSSPSSTLHWNLLIRSFLINASPHDAIRIYNLLISNGCPSPDKFTFPFALAACAALQHLPKGMEIHALALKAGFANNTYVHNNLVNLYFACGVPDYARRVFNGMPVRTVVSWTTMISGLLACGYLDEAREAFDAAPVRNVVTWTAMIDGYARSGRPDEAFVLLGRMMKENVRPNAFTVVALLMACIELGSLKLGRWVHEFAQKNGELEDNVYVGTALIDMYSKCGSLDDAAKVFEGMPLKNFATWNSMIGSLGAYGRAKEAVSLFWEMEKSGVKPDRITLAKVLSACAKAGMVDDGCNLYRHMVEQHGIVPEIEHYKCIVELLGLSDTRTEDEIVYLVRELIAEMDDTGKRMLVEACEDHMNGEVTEIVQKCIHELQALRNCSSRLVELEQSCFEWEVG